MSYKVIDKETYYRKGVFRLLQREIDCFCNEEGKK